MALLAIPALVLAASCDEAPAAALSEIPAQFLGQWDGGPEDCESGGALALTVAPTQLLFAELRVEVTGVEPDGETAARVIGHFSTDEVKWDGSLRLELASGGEELEVVDGAMLKPRVRCP